MSRERETGSRSLHRKIKLSEQWDRRTAYRRNGLMISRLPDEKIEKLRELCRKHNGIELTHEEAAEFGAYLIRLVRAVHGI